MHSRVDTGVSTVYIAAPGGWAIEDVVVRGRSATCSITGSHTAQCRVIETRRTGHHISITASGPGQPDLRATLQVLYRDSLGARDTNYRLIAAT